MYSKTIEQILYTGGSEKFHEELKRQGLELKDYPNNPSTVDDLKKVNETFKHNQNVIADYFKKKIKLETNRIRRERLKSNFKLDEQLRARKFRIAGGTAGAGVGGALGYALSKRATKNTKPGKKRTVIRIGSTIAGAALGGYAGQYSGNKLASRGVKARYKEYIKNK